MDAFEVLGIGRDASEREVRAAFRRCVLESHPDRQGDAPEAQARLRRVIAAYEVALEAATGRARRAPRARAAERREAAPRERLRWVCPCCDDSFAFGGTDCPRCEVPLLDGWSADGRPEAESRAAATGGGRTGGASERWARALEGRAARGPSWMERHGTTAATWALLLGGAGLLHVHAPIGVMFLAYGAVLGAVQTAGERELARLQALRR
jgi:curved DNA-binding protein CbpA